jgi:Flp pilus assembly protein TadG
MRWLRKVHAELWADRASQLVEFAVSLPLLVVFVVGIFDFSGAFTLKQKITNAARNAARAAAGDPATDLGNSTTPASVYDAFQTAQNYITANHLNNCGLSSTNLAQTTGLTWAATSSTCPTTAGLHSISINRAFITNGSIGGTATKIIGTQVTIQYAYTWRFNNVIKLLVSSASYASITTLSVTATAMNEN